MKLLAIETSCDETALTILAVNESGSDPEFSVLSHLVHSQADLHAEYGGVFPNLAKREHAKNILPILRHVLTEAQVLDGEPIQTFDVELIAHIQSTYLDRQPELFANLIPYLQSIPKPDLDAIAVTTGPGLAPSLWVGVNVAKTLAAIWNLPLIPVNHMEGHVVSVFASGEQFTITPPQWPALALLISGGHTELVLMHDWREYTKIGKTQDDAVGEAFDKTARLLGLEYPGGPKISKLAREGQENTAIQFPRPMIHSQDYNFSFSGLKTAVRYTVDNLGTLDHQTKADICKEFEEAVTEVLLKKTKRAIEEYGVKTLIISGGVSASTHIRDQFREMLNEHFPDTKLLLPEMHLTGDNSLMIGIAGYYLWKTIQNKNPEQYTDIDYLDSVTAQGNLSL